MEKRSQFGSRAGFIFAAIGSAIGLGNIWRFPAVAYENGGGAFFIPYLIALLTTGLGFLILEFALGTKYRGSSPLTLARINRKFEPLGWLHVFITFIITTYYAVIIAYSLRYLVSSFTVAWGDDPEGYFFKDILQMSDASPVFGNIVPGVLIPLLLVWAVAFFIAFRGVKKGIESFNKIMIPVLVVLFGIIVIRAITLDGATAGLNALFTPDWSAISHGKVWIAAYGQIFFSLSIGFGIMITYASYLPKKTELTNSALITGFANSSFEMLAGIGVFAALGFMATQLNVPVNEVSASGMGLAFVVFPKILSTMPGSEFFGILFFSSLAVAGLTSLISLLEVSVAAVSDKFQLSRNKAITLIGIPSVLISIVYTTQNGINILDVVDYFNNNFAIIFAALTEIILVLFIGKKTKEVMKHTNAVSHLKIGTGWMLSLKYLTPVLLTYMFLDNTIKTIMNGYGGFETSFVITFGWLSLAFYVIGAFLVSTLKWNKRVPINSVDEDDEQEELSV
ncbi:MAG: sodium-dependent transporter [Bacillaceae bacterium]